MELNKGQACLLMNMEISLPSCMEFAHADIGSALCWYDVGREIRT